jgi:hypothetical protein
LRAQCPQMRERWETLLHAEPITTPLAHPDALVHLINWTLEEVFRELGAVPSRRRRGQRHRTAETTRPACPCGRNPLLAYFAAGEQVLREALVLAQAASPALDPFERDASLEELNLVFQQIARREIESFCGVCQHRNAVTSCTAIVTARHFAAAHAD